MLDLLGNCVIIIVLGLFCYLSSNLNLCKGDKSMKKSMSVHDESLDCELFYIKNMTIYENNVFTLNKTKEKMTEDSFFQSPAKITNNYVCTQGKLKEIILPKTVNMWRSQNAFFVIYSMPEEVPFVARSCLDYQTVYYNTETEEQVFQKESALLVKQNGGLVLAIPNEGLFSQNENIVVNEHHLNYVTSEKIYSLLFNVACSKDFPDWNR